MFPNSVRRGAAIALATGAAGFGWASVANAGGVRHRALVVRGTVVHYNARAHSFVVADARGRLFAIHSRRRPRLASVVTVAIRPLRNGTYGARSLRVDANRRRASVRMHGVVTFVNRRGHSFVLSATGVSMLVRTGARAARVASAAAADPTVGSVVTVTGTVDDQGEVSSSGVTQNTQTTTVDLEGTILAVDTTGQTITLSATDNNNAGGSITVAVPSTLNISLFTVGQEVELTATIGPGGSYTLAGSSIDGSQQAAEDQAAQQGVQGDSVDVQGSSGDNSPDGAQSGDVQTAPSQGDQQTTTSQGDQQTTTTTTVSSSTDN